MAIDITGIKNENEFYTHHYLSAILEKDLKDVFGEWKRKEDEEGVPQPYAKLRGLRKEFFAMHSLLEQERKIEDRLSLQRELIIQLFFYLGYDYHPQTVELDDNGSIPLIGGISRADGSPELWVIEAVNVHGEDSDPLEVNFCSEQYPRDDEIAKVLDLSIEEIITRQVFGRSEPPRWVILISSSQIILLDRTKWNEKRVLRFDIREILDRRENSTLQAMAALLHRDSICPKDGMPLLDTLDENSHKHAFAVSEDLKYSLREAIELLGNEAVWYLKEYQTTVKERRYGRNLAGQLTRELLRYMYRMLFLFYIEARPDLGYLPDKSEEFRKGYSLESLRDLEMIKLNTDESKNGFYIHESIRTLFDLLYNGFQPKQKALFASPDHHTFHITPLRSHLFDPKQTPLLNKVKIRNFVLQRIINLMSLSRPKKGKKNRRGRISYSQLGINQLGAVYEALLSYQGFFAETELYEVKKAVENHNVLDTAYFVKPEDIEQYTEDERVFNDDGTLVKYDKGTFIYRLAGRDREKSASYYTPEVLTQCMVKYALKELLKDKTADEILELTVCEPAMGSAAFLNEAVNQLSKAYLDLKQKEIGRTILHDHYRKELQKVKMYIADNNVYGVDLNPVAVELAEVSLWLNTIYEGAFVPWFGMQLVCGNSLIGARRQVFHESLLKKKKKTDPLWLDDVPKRVMPGEERENDTVYHFLLPDKGMADYKDKVIKQMAADEIKTINEWRKEFTKPFIKSEIDQLKKLSSAVDKLWKRHAEMQRDIDDRTTDPLYVFGQKEPKDKRQLTTTEFKDRIYHQEMFSENIRNSSPYRRLKLVMDYWCALWFWPIEKADLLPSRAEFLFDLTLVLEGNLYDSDVDEYGQQALFPDTRPKQTSLSMFDEFGYVNVDKLCEENRRFKLIQDLSENYRYLHWELEYANLFHMREGFDLVLGNPPWIKTEWNESAVMGLIEPLFVLRNFSASKLASLRSDVLEKYNFKKSYFEAYVEASSVQNFLGKLQNYPMLQGVQPNLYKCFLPLSWNITRKKGVSAFVHPEGIYEDSRGGLLRKFLYSRLRYHFQFQNELRLFPDIHHNKLYSINIYSQNNSDEVSFQHISNLFHPSSIKQCFSQGTDRIVPGIKDDNGNWNIMGHPDRLVKIEKDQIHTFTDIYDDKNCPKTQGRLPAVHSKQIFSVLKKITHQDRYLDNIGDKYITTEMWHETNAQNDGTIKKITTFPKNADNLILSGPQFFVGNPFYKTPRSVCKNNLHYDVIDLSNVAINYLHRTNFIPKCDEKTYRNRALSTPWNEKKVFDYYRLICRKMMDPRAERTLVSAIIPPKVAHIGGCFSLTFENYSELLSCAALFQSLPIDFLIKTTGKANFSNDVARKIPLLKNNLLFLRTLILNCLTQEYSILWEKSWNDAFPADSWAKKDQRLDNNFFRQLSQKWDGNFGLCYDFLRRQALVEIDVLSAMTLGFTISELQSIYRIQFPILKQYENDTWYDQQGTIVFTNNRGLSGVGFPRKSSKTIPIGWEDIKDMKSGTVDRTILDDTMPDGPIERTITYEAPFDRCDREKDYEVVWSEFERRFKEQEGKA